MGEIIRCEIKEFKKLKKKMDKIKKAPEKIQKNIISDFKSNAPSKIADKVVEVYNISKKEITPSSKEKGISAKRVKAGSITANGKTIASVSLVYTGRTLTPSHFTMKPKKPSRGAYILRVKIINANGEKVLGRIKKLTKKQRKNIGRNYKHQGTRNSPNSPNMLMGTGAKSAEKVSYIPFQRVSQERTDLEAVRTLSMPQMVSNEKVQKGIDKELSKYIKGRTEHHIKRYMPK